MSRVVTETPERWSIIKITNGEKTYYKVFGSWRGGYLDGDSWRVNSGISLVEEDDDHYYFHGFSGSCYRCYKKGYGVASSYSESVLNNIIETNNVSGIEVELVSPDTDFKNLLEC
jgi:hypothetical protein